MYSTTRLLNISDPSIERDLLIAEGVHDGLKGKCFIEQEAEGRRVATRTVIYPAEAEGLTRVLSPGDIRADPREKLQEAQHLILQERKKERKKKKDVGRDMMATTSS
jgi:hypothetical protein